MIPLSPLRLLIYDSTCLGSKPYLPGLTHSWIAGKHLYQITRPFHRSFGASSWHDALQFLATIAPLYTIEEIQFWGHGKWGRVMINGSPLDTSALLPDHPYFPWLAAIKARIASPSSLWWFRTCETFGALSGIDFATQWAAFFQCRVAGHTQIIGPWQAGLHAIEAGQTPFWSPSNGLIKGTPEAPTASAYSRLWHPRVISCLQPNLPQWAFKP